MTFIIDNKHRKYKKLKVTIERQALRSSHKFPQSNVEHQKIILSSLSNQNAKWDTEKR